MNYPARTDYLDDSVAAQYEAARFSSRMGRYRYHREQAAVSAMVGQLPRGLVVLDCPVGVGRWVGTFRQRGHTVIGCDVSPAMLARAMQRLEDDEGVKGLFLADAEQLPLPDDSVDVAFSHALTKHLPLDAQRRVLGELARVSKVAVIISFSLLSGVQGVLWKGRRIPHAYGVTHTHIGEWANEFGLTVTDLRRCTTPIGVEHTVLLKHVRES